jgi:hypothetical protein
LFTRSAKSSDLTDGFRMIGRVNPGNNVDWAGPLNGWAQYDNATGRYSVCSAITNSCFYYSPQVIAGSPFINVEVTTRQGCTATGTNCVFRRFQQSWRRRSFIDYVIFTDLETLQPDLYGTGLTVVRSGVSTSRDSAWATLHCAARTDAGIVRDGLTDTTRRQTSNPAPSIAGYYLWPHRPGNDPTAAWDEANTTTQPADRRHEDCFEIAYTRNSGGDSVNGPIHTNDYWFWYCGSPKFLDTVEAGGDPGLASASAASAIFKLATHAGCTTAATTPVDGSSVPITTTASRGLYLKLPDSLSSTITAKIASLTLAPSSGTKVTIVMSAGGRTMSVNTGSGAVTVNIPYRGLVYVNGDLDVQGEGADVTFVASGNLTITGNVTQPSGTKGVTLGFVAQGSTTIKQDAGGADRSVSGAFLSLTGGMSVDGWNDPAAAALASHPTLHLTGAVIAKYRPVFGTYDNTGQLQTGMYKDIKYPTDAAGNKLPPTPPYFIEPVNAVWVRLDLAETPIQTAAPGLTPRPANGLVAPSTAHGSCDKTWPAASGNGVPAAYVPACLI